MIHSCGRESLQFIGVQQLAVLDSYFTLKGFLAICNLTLLFAPRGVKGRDIMYM